VNPILDAAGSSNVPHDPFALCQLAILRWRDRQKGNTPLERAVATELDALIGELAAMWRTRR
jgi:hypothetical protein